MDLNPSFEVSTLQYDTVPCNITDHNYIVCSNTIFFQNCIGDLRRNLDGDRNTWPLECYTDLKFSRELLRILISRPCY